MERESDLLHLLIEHQVILFIIGALVIMTLLGVVGYFVGRRTQRKEKRNEK